MPRMADSSAGVFEFNSVVRGIRLWTPAIDEMLQVVQEEMNNQDEYAIAIIKEERIVGHVPREVSRICAFFKDMAPLHVESPVTERKELGWRYHVLHSLAS